MGTSISQDKDKASPSFYPDETDNLLKNENTSCFVEQNSPDNDKNYNYAAIDLNFGDIEFSTYQPTDLKKKSLYEELEYLKWTKFMIAIRSYINSKICNGIMALKYPILNFFYDNPNFDVDTGISLFVNAFKNINPFWNECSILC